jgi:mono/diheme cytochrome c family protein
MRRGLSLAGSIAAIAAMALAAFGCAEEEYPVSLWLAQHPSPPDASVGASMASTSSTSSVQSRGPAYCRQAQAQSLPARLVALSANASASPSAAPTGQVILASDLYEQNFLPVCGGTCHGPQADPPGLGGFQIASAGDFKSKMSMAILQHVINATCPKGLDPSDPNDPMPPCSSPDGLMPGKTFADRPDTDPVKQFVTVTQAWLLAGSPVQFTLPTGSDAGTGEPSSADAGDAGAASQFGMTPQTGDDMTNIGNCIPSAGLIGTDTARMATMDAKFAAMTAQLGGTAQQAIGLPEHLGDTDLYTFDSALLAQSGVVAYAPGYPLWSDNAGKLRFVRVPMGQSIAFDKTTQQFDIPPNTRFYKTFMKQIIDTDGSYRYRKIETRLIVSRPDQNNADGTVNQTALFGTYRWNDDESDAVLVETPLISGEPFADTVLLYNTDEELAADVLKSNPAEPEIQLVSYNAARHYAIPSSQRCMQCHMGSPSQSFVLGFTPLQINRMPTGTHGVIEAAGPDELTQLQRFIDAGIVTGLDSPSDVPPLEQSQGGRSPRNNYELTAQGYMLGNCAHCHNPRGYPTVQNPVLKDVLNFLPSEVGGIFQFPLESYSPRIGRGPTGTTLIPYVTPSLVDLPKIDPVSGGQVGDWFIFAPSMSVAWVDYAPWRSLIYRNVDNAFAYTDDDALFPHMPMNTPGYDPRAKQILGDWMVSIPAVRKHPELPEYAYQTDSEPQHNVPNSSPVDTEPQPYVEVLPGTPGYADAVAAATARLAVWHTAVNPALPTTGTPYVRYADPGQTDDILDPAVVADPLCHPIPVGDSATNDTPVPVHPNWVITDLSEPPGAWSPRRADWAQVLVEQMVPPPNTNGCSASTNQMAAYEDQLDAISILQNTSLAQVEPYVNTAIPFGLWQAQSGCNLQSMPTVGSFTGAARPHWMDVAPAPSSDAPVYSETPGAAVFKMICINCHGPNADSNGRMAQNLATMTGGLARVADFRDGLFGPVGSSDTNDDIHAVFGTDALSAQGIAPPPNWTEVDGAPLADDDRAARYMPWMALGGTEVSIPPPILEIVAITKVLDQQRTIGASQLSANMLSEAKAICLSLLGPTEEELIGQSAFFQTGAGHGYLDAKLTHLNNVLIPSNGDAELWLKLCSLNNPPPIRILALKSGALTFQSYVVDSSQALSLDLTPTMVSNDPNVYPAGVPVGNESGGVDPSLDAANEWPWCVSVPQAYLDANPGLPVCPDSALQAAQTCTTMTGGDCFDNAAANKWAVHGAINAGMAVFLYVKSIENTGPAPDYNQCNLLP